MSRIGHGLQSQVFRLCGQPRALEMPSAQRPAKRIPTARVVVRAALFAMLVAALQSGCAENDTEGNGQTLTEPKPTACMIAGGSFEQCYNGWPLPLCTPPNQFLLDQTCADQGLCRDSCSGTWVPCDMARSALDCVPSGTGNSNEGEGCSSDSSCGAGLVCRHYLENTSNEKRCVRPCATHADCPGVKPPDFATAFNACDFCGTHVSQPVCVPFTICGIGVPPSDACNNCLDACRGLPSCCTGEGCMCDSDC